MSWGAYTLSIHVLNNGVPRFLNYFLELMRALNRKAKSQIRELSNKHKPA